MKGLGGILLAVGILIAGASGLCSVVFFVTEITSPYTKLRELFYLLVLFGGIPFAIGMGLVFVGRRISRRDS